jgi:hypothetical protein
MARNTDKTHALLIQRLVDLIGPAREPFIETGRKFDKVYVDGKVRYFVARTDVKTAKAGDILGAKSKLAPNFRWFFGTLENADKWDWSEYHGKPVSDETVMQEKGYGSYVHYVRKT